MNIDWIFFDVGGVLCDESEFLKIRQQYNFETIKNFQPETIKEDILNIWGRASEMLGSLDENVIHLSLKNKEKVPEAIELMKSKRASLPKYYDLLKTRKEAVKVIPELAKKYKLGIMANQSIEARNKLTEAGIFNYFKNTDMSADHKLSKPDPEFFKRIFEITGANPKTSVLIDDNVERGISPAKKLGMTTVWFKLENRNSTVNEADFQIESLEELLKIF